MDSGIYCITDMQTGRRYVGSAVSFRKRWREHRRGLESGKHHSRFLQRTFNARPDDLKFQALIYCDRDNLLMYEQRFLDAWKPEFNTNPTAGSMSGFRHRDESRKKMSDSRRKDFSPMAGKKHTEETKAKISESRKGKGGGPRTAERCANISKALKGRVVPHEIRARISATLTGTSTGRGKLTNDQVRQIRMLDSKAMRQCDIARELSLPRKWVHTVVAGHGYGWVD